MNTLLTLLITLLTGGGLVAGSMLLSAWQTSRDASKRDKATHAHELAMAQEARRKQWLKETYDELGIYLARHEDWAISVRPFRGQISPPDRMLPAEKWRIQALVMNHGSPEVRPLLKRWTELATKIEKADEVIGLADRARGHDPALEQEAHRERRALEDYGKALFEAADDISRQMKAELDGQAAQGES